jgi:uncharacterized protein (TIGR03083 family)
VPETPWLSADSSAAGLTAQLAEVWNSLRDLGRDLSDDDWSCPTPCPGWPVSAQYAHMIGTESMLLGRKNPDIEPGRPEHVRNDIGGFNEVWVAALASVPRTEVLEQFAEVTGARQEVLQAMTEDAFDEPAWTPVGQADYRRFMQIRVFDCWVHEQDIRDALKQPGHEAGPVAEQSVDEVVRAIGYIVGKKAGVPAGASVRLELTGPVTRTVNVDVADGRARPVPTLSGEPSTTVTLPSPVFTRLACGRVDPAAVMDQVSFRGDLALGRQVAEHLAFTI